MRKSFLTKATLISLFIGLFQIIGASSAFASNYSFTSAGATGRSGPTQSQINTAYSGTNLAGAVTVTASGIQKFTVPLSGQYSIELAGAKGGNSSVTGGSGAKFSTNAVTLTQGEVLQIGIGQVGIISSDSTGAGGGGASWVYRESNSSLIAIAGGGGGGGIANVTNARSTAQNNSTGNGEGGSSSGGQQPNGGTNGSGGINSTNTCGLGGAGWLGNGTSSASCGRAGTSAAIQISSTALGGVPDSGSGANAVGGFGGGGAGAGNCGYGGGGGGYSGGGGGSYNAGCGGPGGAGGSYSNAGFNWIGTNASVGYITFRILGPSVSSFTPVNTITKESAISYSLNFSENVNGLTSSDFILSGGGSSTCSITPTGSGSTYSINLSGCSQGLVTLTLSANSITSNTSQSGPLSSVTAATVTIDQTSPTISTVTAPSNATYKPVDTPTFTVAFSESVTVTGTPRFTLTVGAITKYANYVSQTDSRTALFRYTVASSTSEFDTDGISISNSIDLNGGSIADLATNALSTLTFSAPNTSSIFVAQPPAAPTIDSATAGSGFIRLNFTAGSTYGSAITNYQYSTNNGLNWTVRSPVDTSTPLTISGLTNGTSYQVRIRAVSAVGTSDSSTSITATPNAVTVAGGSNISTTFGRSDSSTVFTSTGGVGPYVYTLSSSVTGITISNGVVTTSSTLNAGTYSLNVVSTDSYLATGSKAITITVAKARQDTLTITSSAGVFNGNASSLFLMTSGGSDTGTVTFADAGGGTASGCTFSGSTLQVTSAGTCKIVATKAATTNFLIAYSETATITFAQFVYNQPVQSQSVPTQLPINGQNSLDVSQATTVPAVTGVFLVNSTYEINGTGFTGVNRVVIGGSEATIISSTSTKIVIDSASLTPGPLFIECSDGRIGPSPFYFFAP